MTENDINACARQLNKAATPSSEVLSDDRYFDFYKNLKLTSPPEKIKRYLNTCENHPLIILNGQRGNGKTTELQRLASLLLQDNRYAPIYINLLDVVDPTIAIDINHLLIAVAAAISENLDSTPNSLNSFWEFLNQAVKLEGIETPNVSIGHHKINIKNKSWGEIKLSLRGQEIVKDVREKLLNKELSTQSQVNNYLDRLFKNNKKTKGKKVVVLLDSLEQARDNSQQATQVLDSLLSVFSAYLPRLRFTCAAVIWSAPPVVAMEQNIQQNADLYYSLPIIPVVKYDEVKEEYCPDPSGINTMVAVINTRIPEVKEVFSMKTLQAASWFSSGGLRMSFRLLARALLETKGFDQEEIHRSFMNILQEFKALIPFKTDAELLSQIRKKRSLFADDSQDNRIDILKRFGRLSDNFWIVHYRDHNNHDWYAPSRLADFDSALQAWQKYEDQLRPQ